MSTRMNLQWISFFIKRNTKCYFYHHMRSSLDIFRFVEEKGNNKSQKIQKHHIFRRVTHIQLLNKGTLETTTDCRVKLCNKMPAHPRLHCTGVGVIILSTLIGPSPAVGEVFFQELRSSGLTVQGDPVSRAKNELPVHLHFFFLSQSASCEIEKNTMLW